MGPSLGSRNSSFHASWKLPLKADQKYGGQSQRRGLLMWNDRCSRDTPTLVRAIDSSRTLLYDGRRTNIVVDASESRVRAAAKLECLVTLLLTVLFDLERRQHLRLLQICCRCVNRHDIRWSYEYGLLVWQLISEVIIVVAPNYIVRSTTLIY